MLVNAMAGFAAPGVEKAKVFARPNICVRSYGLQRPFKCRKDDAFIIDVIRFRNEPFPFRPENHSEPGGRSQALSLHGSLARQFTDESTRRCRPFLTL